MLGSMMLVVVGVVRLAMEAHVKAGLNGGTWGAETEPDRIWTMASVAGRSLAEGCEQANPRSRSLLASSST